MQPSQGPQSGRRLAVPLPLGEHRQLLLLRLLRDLQDSKLILVHQYLDMLADQRSKLTRGNGI
jgi:hypothetical protein